MPTKLLVWNVQFFTDKKINPEYGRAVQYVDVQGNHVSLPIFDKALNVKYICSNINLADAHIFVLIENLSKQGVIGSLAGGKGASGCIRLLGMIRAFTNNQDWMLVPPLKTVNKLQVEEVEPGESDLLALVKEGAYTECVSVFYRSNLLEFVGPYVWPRTADNNSSSKVACRDTGQEREAYPALWNGTYPANNYFAGQFQFFKDPADKSTEVLFPDIGSRRPFLTQFREKGGAHRLITLVSVHYPPRAGDASTAFARTLEFFDEKHWPIQANEVILVAGDLNLDYLGATKAGLYDVAHFAGFSLALSSPTFNWPTMMKRSKHATPESYKKHEGLDNVVSRTPLNAPLGAGVHVFDRVIGDPPPSLMFTSMAEIMGLKPQDRRNDVFRLPQNYQSQGPVPGVSDHLPVYFQF